MADPQTDRLLSEFMDAWNAGERPEVAAFLDRAPEGSERDELAELLATFLEHAPTPRYSAEALAEIMREPALERAGKSVEGRSGLWPSLLPRLRDRAKIRRADLVARLAEALGVADREAKVAAYYHEMERGLLPAEGVSDRVLEALGRVLGESAAALREAGRMIAPGVAEEDEAVVFARTARPDAGLLAEAEEEVEAVAADLAPPEPVEWDEVDDLFRGAEAGRG